MKTGVWEGLGTGLVYYMTEVTVCNGKLTCQFIIVAVFHCSRAHTQFYPCMHITVIVHVFKYTSYVITV